jgi:type I restriction enzyme M protein
VKLVLALALGVAFRNRPPEPVEVATGYLNAYRILISDLVLVTGGADEPLLEAIALVILGQGNTTFYLGIGTWIAAHVPYERRGRVTGLIEVGMAQGIDHPHIWHGNTLTGAETYGGLFTDAPGPFDVILMNPPFGGKEGKDAQTRFAYKTGATQVLFLQHIFDSLKDGGVCGIVMDEGVLFRTNEGGFVGTKRKLCDDFEVFCIVSLPGGVFTSAGAGVKTNLMFFTKGEPTESIWYFDLSDVKVGKKTPLTRAHFDELFRLLPTRGDSDRSWTVPFASNLQQALEEARPHRERATQLFSEAKSLEDEFKEKRKGKSLSPEALIESEERWKTVLREARETDAKAQSIEDAVYDLKAVNPNKPDVSDKRTPAELISFIQEKGREADAALARLQALMTQPTG